MVKVKPVSILRIEDRNGVPLFKHRFKEEQVLDENLVVTLVDTMRGIVDYGTGRGAKLPRPIAGKTGTTSITKMPGFLDLFHNWFVQPGLVMMIMIQ